MVSEGRSLVRTIIMATMRKPMPVITCNAVVLCPHDVNRVALVLDAEGSEPGGLVLQSGQIHPGLAIL